MTRHPKSKQKVTRRSVLAMNADDARAFFLKPESYCSFDLPPYFNFARVLRSVDSFLKENRPKDKYKANPREYDGVNYTIYSNKDGRYAWRPFQLIHPVIYVELVHQMTEVNAWSHIVDRFKRFAAKVESQDVV